jgi:hypothetical protein
MEAWDDGLYCRREDVVLRRVAGEHLLVPIRGNVADMTALYALVGAAITIWDELARPRTLNEVVASLVSRFDVTEETAREDAQNLLQELVNRGLAERRA